MSNKKSIGVEAITAIIGLIATFAGAYVLFSNILDWGVIKNFVSKLGTSPWIEILISVILALIVSKIAAFSISFSEKKKSSPKDDK